MVTRGNRGSPAGGCSHAWRKASSPFCGGMGGDERLPHAPGSTQLPTGGARPSPQLGPAPWPHQMPAAASGPVGPSPPECPVHSPPAAPHGPPGGALTLTALWTLLELPPALSPGPRTPQLQCSGLRPGLSIFGRQNWWPCPNRGASLVAQTVKNLPVIDPSSIPRGPLLASGR